MQLIVCLYALGKRFYLWLAKTNDWENQTLFRIDFIDIWINHIFQGIHSTKAKKIHIENDKILVKKWNISIILRATN